MKPKSLKLSNQVSNQVNGLIINSLEELVAFCNQAGNQESVEVSDQVYSKFLN